MGVFFLCILLGDCAYLKLYNNGTDHFVVLCSLGRYACKDCISHIFIVLFVPSHTYLPRILVVLEYTLEAHLRD
jgi:hypothetical protein